MFCRVGLAAFLCARILQAQPADPSLLRHDEAISLDQIEFTAGATCEPLGISARFDRIAFLNAAGTELAAVDIGAQADSYFLGQGWGAREGGAQANTRSSALKVSFFFALPSGATTMRVSASGICAVTVQATVNSVPVGSFTLTAGSAVTAYTLTLQASLTQRVTYTVLSGGPVSIASIQWLGQAGTVLGTSNTAVTATGTPQSQTVLRPTGTTTFCVNFASAPPASSLQVAVNSAASSVLSIAGGVTRACALESDSLGVC
jgi:hypothetical protein